MKITNQEFNSIIDEVRRTGAHSIKVKRVGMIKTSIILRYGNREGYHSRMLEKHNNALAAERRWKLLSGWLKGVE